MKKSDVVSAYKCRFYHTNSIALADTARIYTDICNYLKNPVLLAWDKIKTMQLKDACMYIEHLIHATKRNPEPLYKNFDKKFYKCPCYIRRDAVCNVIGHIKAYYKNLANWENSDRSTKKPSLPVFKHEMPILYKDNMFIRTGTYEAHIKVFMYNDWVWMPVTFRKSDIDYIRHHCSDRTQLSPKLKCIHKKWYLVFTFKEPRTELNNVDVYNRRVLAVDLGLNQPAVCSVMNCKGTILSRNFLHLDRDTDHLRFVLKRIKRAQKHGSRSMPALWSKAKGVNKHIAVKTVEFIINQAVKNGVHVIVFEHLDLQGKKKGSRKQLLHMWNAKTVQQIVTTKAHRLGIRISHVNARNTSALAFDGSGKVTRGTYYQNGKLRYNYSICVFPNKKTYHCDLNASYNIGARYFIRELLKTLQETVKSDILAKVPKCSARSTCTLSSLISLNAALKA